MKIAYYNPYLNSAENQLFVSMQSAGQKIGMELAECKDDIDICAFDPDFVISVTSQVPKVTHHPSYLAMHEPKTSIFVSDAKFKNILSYDGYLTISDSLVRFIRDFSFGVGRQESPGFFYLTPQRTGLSVDWREVTKSKDFRIAYFGTNWASRMPGLLDRLDRLDILRIHGPRAAWESKNYNSYQGPVDFDGVGPQRVYAECGCGLVLLDEKWQNEDIISNRIFEISSVGAISFCPDIPWIRKWFGESVLYFDPSGHPDDISQRIKDGYDFCRLYPSSAQEMAANARRVFESNFAAEKMLQNLADYHEQKILGSEQRVASVGPEADISVIVRCGGRSTDRVGETVKAITAQTFGKFHIIFAKYQDIDLSDLFPEMIETRCSFEEFLIPGGSRATMLYEALRRVDTEYFSVLDDDDSLMPDHFEHLFAAGRRASPKFDVAFSGTMDVGIPVDLGAHTPCNRVVSRFGFTEPLHEVWQLYSPIHIGSMVARKDLLSADVLEIPDMRTAEDSLLVGIVSRRSRPVFSYKPTFMYSVGSEGGSNWRNDPARKHDEISQAIRSGLSLAPVWMSGSLSIGGAIPYLIAGDVQKERAVDVVSERPVSIDKPRRNLMARLVHKPSILLGPLAPRWRAYKARRRSARESHQ